MGRFSSFKFYTQHFAVGARFRHKNKLVLPVKCSETVKQCIFEKRKTTYRYAGKVDKIKVN